MKPVILLLLSCLLIHALRAQTTAEKVEEFMEAANKAKLFNGTVLVARRDSILFAKGYGWRDYENRVPHDTNSIFCITSVTKQFTAVVILYLQEHNKLKITDKVSKYFPEYKNGDKITIRHLLTHTSGIIEYSNEERFFEELVYKPYKQEHLWKFIKDESLSFEPGSEYEYVNTNYFILGYLIEKITGKPYEQNVREIIFNKAGMKHSGFDFARLKSPYKTVGYDVLNDSVQTRARITDSSAAYAAAGIYSTVFDMYRWHKALLSNKIISRQSLEEAFTPNLEGYGYGWNIRPNYRTQLISDMGGMSGFQTLFSQMPKDNTCYVVFSNDYSIIHNEEKNLNFFDLGFLHILANIPNYYLPRIATKVTAATLSEYTGLYKKDTTISYIINIIRKDDHLYTKLNNGQANELFEERKDFFFLKSINCQIEFERDAAGKIKNLVVYFNKQKALYRKTE